MTHLLLRTLLTLATVAAAPAAKKPWALTIDERLSMRANSELAAERIGAVRRMATAGAKSSSQWVDQFNGKDHPELFFPHEVFKQLVEMAYAGPPRANEIVRSGFTPEVRRYGFPPDFWERLQVITAPHIADVNAARDNLAALRLQNGRARQRAEQALALSHADVCRSRADALAAARKAFGSERFDRFLYEVIVTGMFHSEDRVADPELLRRAEGGCR